MMDKEKKIADIRNKISYWTEQLKTINNSIDRGVISDKILEAKRELGKLESKTLDGVKRVDIIDAPPVADRLELQKYRARSGLSIDRNKITFKF